MRSPIDSGQPARTAATPAPQVVHWVIALLLAFLAGVFVMQSPGSLLPIAAAQNAPAAGARGIYAFTGQLDRDHHGLFMLDIDQGTLWCYEFETVDGVRKLRLVSGRTWIYDRYLQDFNVSGLTYHQVQELIARERREAADRERNAPASPDRATPESKPKD